MITTEQEKEFNAKVIKDFQEALYNMNVEQTFDIVRLKKHRTDEKRLAKIATFDKQIAACDRELADLEAQIKTCKSKDRQALRDKAQKVLEQREAHKAGRSQLTVKIDRMYQEISARAAKMKGVTEMIEFLTKFQLAVQEELPYAEINGTRYLMKNNIIQTDEFGREILYVQNGKADTAKKNS